MTFISRPNRILLRNAQTNENTRAMTLKWTLLRMNVSNNSLSLHTLPLIVPQCAVILPTSTSVTHKGYPQYVPPYQTPVVQGTLSNPPLSSSSANVMALETSRLRGTTRAVVPAFLSTHKALFTLHATAPFTFVAWPLSPIFASLCPTSTIFIRH